MKEINKDKEISFEIEFNTVGTIGDPELFDDANELPCRIYAYKQGVDTGLKTDIAFLEIEDNGWGESTYKAKLVLTKHNIRQLVNALEYAKRELYYDDLGQ